MLTKLLMLTALIGHILCWYCDRRMTFLPGGIFSFKAMQYNDKLSKIFAGMPLRQAESATLLGIPALLMSFFGLWGISEWMRGYSQTASVILFVSAVVFVMVGVVHHVCCGMTEWFYVRLGRTEEARQTVLEFFKRTSVTMIVCYLGLIVYFVTFFIAVVSGATPLPRIACLANTILFFILLTAFRVHNGGNLANAAFFLCCLILL